MMVTYVDHQANIYTLFRTDFWEQSVHVEIFEKSVEALRKIRTYTGTDFWVQKSQKWWNFHGMVQCYGLMWHSNFLHLVTSSRTALVTQRRYVMELCYSVTFMSVPALNKWENRSLRFLKQCILWTFPGVEILKISWNFLKSYMKFYRKLRKIVFNIKWYSSDNNLKFFLKIDNVFLKMVWIFFKK